MTDLHAPLRRIESTAPLQPVERPPAALSTAAAHPTLLERLELRLTVWLLLRHARRHRKARDYADHHRQHLNRELHARYDRERLRAHSLAGPRL